MNNSTYRFTLDLQKHNSQMSIAVFRYDTAVRLYISLTDGGKPYYISDGNYAVFYGKRADGETLSHKCMIRENTEIVYDFEDTTACVDGVVDCQIRLYGKDNQIISAPKFIIVVDERVVTDEDFEVDGNTLSAFDNIFFTESERIAAEQARDWAENGRFDEDGNLLVPGRVQAEEERTSVWVRYSANADGTDYTDEWHEGQHYIGVATSHDEPKDKSEYEWCLFRGEQGEKGEKGDKGDKGEKGDLGILPNKSSEILLWAFGTNGTHGLEYTFNSDTVACSGIDTTICPDADVEIGDVFYGMPVIGIADMAFFAKEHLINITIPDSITSIGTSALAGCSSLTNITIPNGVNSIGGAAFSGCSSLVDITIPYGVNSIGWHTFWKCSNLVSVSIPNSVASIDEGAFGSCSKLASIIIPNGVNSIATKTFEMCSSLASVTIPNSVTSIGEYAFDECSNLASVTIPDSVTSIDTGAFRKCSSLTNITIPDSITSMGNSVFASCTSITNAKLGDGITSISFGTFSGCSNLAIVNIPVGVTSIGGSAFNLCSNLTSITIPDGVTSIGDGAFFSCTNLASIIIPKSVTAIGTQAFGQCPNLTKVFYSGTADEWASIDVSIANAGLANAEIIYNYGG